MIPISDTGVSRHRLPYVNVALLAINAIVFLYELTLGDRSLFQFYMAYGVVPIELTTGRDIPPLGPPELWMNIFSSMFIHGGWLHFGGNMLYLWVFGDNVEDTFSHLGYLVFYLFAGVVATLAQVYTNPLSTVPAIGASGAIAGVLGAYLVLFPKAKVNTLIILFYFVRMQPLPAILVLGFWIVTQVFSGVASLGASTGIAYFAHIGGFVAGVILAVPLRGRAKRAPTRYLEE
ncbi:MAG: rhomboid family intramembrane serine protease [Dehalococcoidia bacterium]|nr:rhomboid family intramembrane serine protease [Dehalococcoidia bacterium]